MKKRILISAGPTREALDPVRFLSNRSTGKMGYALAEAAISAGFETVLVSGPVSLEPPQGLHKFISVVSASEMAEAMKSEFAAADITVMCAAVADFTPVNFSASKIKKDGSGMTLELKPTEDILKSLGTMKQPHQTLAGFAAETDDLEQNAMSKLKRKNLDWIIGNRVGVQGEGFGADTNAAVMFSASGKIKRLPLDTKKKIAEQIIRTVSDGK